MDLYGLSTNQPASWHPEPSLRGTYNILSTCLITISLCVWTAVHLNIPQHGKASRQSWRKVMWLLTGLFAPEVVAWTAFRQHRAASKLNITMRQKLGQKAPVGFYQNLAELFGCSKSRRSVDDWTLPRKKGKPLWTMIHSHYAAMGGFAINTCEESPHYPHYFQYLRHQGQLTVTLDGIKLLADLDVDLIPSLSASEIQDKSKASGLGKALVCIQAVWFCVQCVVRLAQGLKISLLELNTFAHAICTLLIYLLWWHKPLDVERPTVIEPDSEPRRQAIALLCMASEFGRKQESPSYYDVYVQPTFGRSPRSLLGSKFQGDMTDARTQKPYLNGANLCLGEELHGFYIYDFYIHEYGDINGEAAAAQAENPISDPIYLRLESGQVRCMMLASQAIDRYSITTWDCSGKDGILQHRTPNQPQLSGFESSFSKDSLSLVVGLSIAGFVYGGMHLSAWNAPFPTTQQQLLWRVSGLVLVLSGPALMIRRVVEHVVSKWNVYSPSGCLGSLTCCVVTIPTLSWIFTIIAAYSIYLLARIYLVVECFIDLGYLPDSVYLVPQWTKYIPHIS